jgi:hypothetical protein
MEGLEPELRGGTPRNVRLTASTRFARYALWLLVTVVLGFMQWQSAVDMGQLRDLAARGQKAVGAVDGLDVVRGKHNTYYVDYRFRTNDTGLFGAGRVSVSESEFELYQMNESIVVTYLPDHLDVSRIGIVNADRIDRAQRHATTGLLLMGTMLALLLGGLEWYCQGRLRLLRDGTAVVGQAMSCEYVGGKGNPYKLSFHYDPETADRVYRTIRVSSTTNKRISDGSPLTVLYMCASPGGGLPYLAITEAEVAPSG